MMIRPETPSARGRRRSPLFSVLVALGVAQLSLAGTLARSQTPTAGEIADSIARSHEALLRVPGGVKLTYRLHVDQDRRLGGFAWRGGRGEVSILWPIVYNTFKAQSARDQTSVDREGEYNFETGLSAGRSESNVSIAPYRQTWSSAHLYPLRFLFMEEATQRYSRERDQTTDYWLPSALRQAAYAFRGQESVGGILCQVFRRTDGIDALWVAPKHGFTVCKREIRDESGRLIEATVNSRLREIVRGVWLPTRLVQERYSKDPSVPRWDLSKPTCTLTVVIEDVATSKVDAKSLHIRIPRGAYVMDQIRNVQYRKASLGHGKLDVGVKEGKSEVARGASIDPGGESHTLTLVLGCIFCALTVVTITILWGRATAGAVKGKRATATLATFFRSGRGSHES